MILDMTFENREHMIRRDSREEGRAEGREEGRIEALFELYDKCILDKTVAIESSYLSEEMIDETLKNYNKTI